MTTFSLDDTKYKYKRIKLKDAAGKTVYSANNADAVSRAMLGMTKDEIIKAAMENNLDHLKKHFTKNTGHLRMIIGQALRSLIHKNRSVTVRDIKIERLDQSVDWPNGYVEKPIKRQIVVKGK